MAKSHDIALYYDKGETNRTQCTIGTVGLRIFSETPFPLQQKIIADTLHHANQIEAAMENGGLPEVRSTIGFSYNNLNEIVGVVSSLRQGTDTLARYTGTGLTAVEISHPDRGVDLCSTSSPGL